MKANGHIARLTAACMIATALFGGAASAESITVTAERLNLRKAADASSKSMGIVEEKDTLSFVSESGKWYQVTDGKKTGYVMKEYVSLDRAQVRADVEKNTEAYSASAKAKERVNMRELPMTDADIERVVGKGDEVQITGRCGDWYQVSCGGKTGYIMAEYLTVGGEASDETESAPADTAVETLYAEAKSAKASARVNLREEASTGSDIEKVVGEGAALSVLGECGGWYKISCGGKTGYIMKEYVLLGASENDAQTGGDTLYAQSMTGETTDRVNLREQASSGSDIEKVIDQGREVEILGENGEWYKVKYSGKTGYISKSYIRMTGGTDKEDETVDAVVPDGFVSYPAARTGATNERVNLRETASSDADVLKVLNQNASLTVLGEAGGYYQVRYGETLGYIAKAYVTLGVSGEEETTEEETASDETLYSSVKTMYTTVRVNMRRAPEGDVLHTLSADTQVSVVGEAGSWYKVSYSTSVGYISKAYLAEKAEISVPSEPESDNQTEVNGGTTGYITGASVNMRKGAGTGFGVIKVLKQGEEITFYTLSDGWYLIKAGEDTGYVSEKYVSKTKPESAPAQPESSSDTETEQVSGKVQMADWWTSNIQKTFKVGVIATVTDVDTGLSWRVKRSGGSNHADVQPLTAADTAKMKQAYGGSWSWNRRAIWVTVDGVSYAASMNGMPHGTGSITDNNFDGHHCIHFLNSRTHTGNRWDTAHQAAVQKAYKAGQ